MTKDTSNEVKALSCVQVAVCLHFEADNVSCIELLKKYFRKEERQDVRRKGIRRSTIHVKLHDFLSSSSLERHRHPTSWTQRNQWLRLNPHIRSLAQPIALCHRRQDQLRFH